MWDPLSNHESAKNFLVIGYLARKPYMRDAASARKRRVGVEWGAGIASQPTSGSGERRKLPQRGPAQSPGEKRFYCFLSVSERVSLQRWLKINRCAAAVHDLPPMKASIALVWEIAITSK